MKVCYFFMAGIISIMFASCTSEMAIEKMAIVKNTSSFLKVEVIDEFAAAATRADYSGFPSTTFETGDAIGLYAFDGSSYVASNVRFVKQSDGSWLPDEDIPYSEDYTFYAYFPYRATTYTPSTLGTVDAVDTKFSNFISDASNYFWQADQSTKAGFTYSNLMIAKGIVTDVDTDAATVKFTMKHKRGLAIIGELTSKWYYSDATNTKYTPTLTFTGNIPYENNGMQQFLVKPDFSTTVAGQSVSIPSGKYDTVIITLTGTPTYNYSTNNEIESYDWSAFTTVKPDWLTIDDSTDDFIVTTTATPCSPSVKKDIKFSEANDLLKAATPVSDVDLSMVDNAGNARASRTTANCYLIHAPGTYKLPLVYGNAIKDGVTNERSYYSSVGYSGVHKLRLVNHNDAMIVDPWLKNNSATPNGATLVWQDVKNMITSVGIDGDYLTFTVDENNIEEGNAVVAATMSGTVVWSWHIWATTQTLDNLTTVDTGSGTYRVAPVNVGEISGRITMSATAYTKGVCKVRAIYDGITAEFRVISKQSVSGGNDIYNPALYYQWGRKDPFYTVLGKISSDGTITKDPTYQYSTSSGWSIGTTIKNPEKGYCYRNNSSIYIWSNESMRNYWNIDNTLYVNNINVDYSPTKKTIYDPCPPGFCVPTNGLFYFMGDGNTRTCTTYNNTMKGAYWNIGITGEQLWFKCLSARTANGMFYNPNISTASTVQAYYWSSIGDSGGMSMGMDLVSKNLWRYKSFEYSGNAYPVRPVAEE